MKFRKKPIIVDAYQWLNVQPFVYGVKKDVDYFRDPELGAQTKCPQCSATMHEHGWMGDGGHLICPGDWIITGAEGEKYPCKPSVFEATYEKVV